MDDKFKRHRSLILFTATFSIIVIISYASYLGVGKEVLRMGEAVVIPIRTKMFSFSEYLGLKFESIKELSQLREQLVEAELELVRYRNIKTEIELLRAELKELNQLVGFREVIPFKTTLAKVIAKDPQNGFSTIIINKGAVDGVEIGMPVIAFSGESYALAGKVSEVDEYTARIATIFDPRCKIGVEIGDGHIGIMKGQLPASKTCLIENVDRQVTNLIGLPVYTSDVGRKYPKGIHVGVVENVFRKNYGLFQEVEVTSDINIFTLENVFVFVKNK